MPENFRCLVASNDDDFREELIERAVSLNFSVKAIRLPNELPRMLQEHGFDWLILDVGLGESACLQIVDTLGAGRKPPRTILIGGGEKSGYRFGSKERRPERAGTCRHFNQAPVLLGGQRALSESTDQRRRIIRTRSDFSSSRRDSE